MLQVQMLHLQMRQVQMRQMRHHPSSRTSIRLV
jgi:hypothetical protein